MTTYEDLGFDRLISRRKPVTTEQTEAASSVVINQVPEGAIAAPIPKEKVTNAVTDLVKISGVSQASSGLVSSGTGIRLTSTLSDASGQARVMLGIPEITVYMDTVSSTTVVPYGSNAIASGHNLTEKFDLLSNLVGTNSIYGKSITAISHVQNSSGSSHSYTWHIRWRWIGNDAA